MKKIIFTEKAPVPMGAYNQAILIDNTLYTSGQIGLDPITGELINNNIEKETKQVMENMKALLEAAEMSFNDVIKATIFISDMDDFSKINAIYETYFNKKTAPAREMIQVAGLPKNANIEIVMIGIKDSIINV